MPEIIVLKGNITEVDADAIVNPANSRMIMGGGVAGAIKRKGGDDIEKEAIKYAPVPVGEAVITHAGRLRAKFVIHAPTMEEPAMRTTVEKVKKAILAALKLAEEKGLESIAFPGMGTGVGGLTAEQGARAFKEAYEEFARTIGFRHLKRILLVAFTDDLYEAFSKVKEELEKGK